MAGDETSIDVVDGDEKIIVDLLLDVVAGEEKFIYVFTGDETVVDVVA